jgi:hypothetical protein
MGCSPREFRKKNFFHHTYARLPKEYVSLQLPHCADGAPASQLLFRPLPIILIKPVFKSWLPAREFLDNASIASAD